MSIDTYTLTCIIDEMIQEERQRTTRYIENNPTDSTRRNMMRSIYEGALNELLYKVKEVTR